jgi:UDP-N-acetylmuramoyl-tripeptide--D-alanyl-D-alanine ligase
MLSASVDTILHVTDGELLLGARDLVATDVCLDSRHVGAGCAFVALPGERVDGHDFAPAAVSAGARVVLVTKPAVDLAELLGVATVRNAAVIRVSSALGALQQLAAYHRSRLHCQVLGITGSTGKTTTKDLVTAVLSASKRVVATTGNHNNEIGVPLTILRADANTDVLVVEMGMRGPGQIAELCDIARPSMALVTNVGTSHIELLGSQDEIARAKSEIVQCLSPEGVAFLNGDDEYSGVLASATGATIVRYGLSAACDVSAEEIELDEASRASFTVAAGEERFTVSLSVPGRHNVYNALAAIAVGLRLGVPAEQIPAALASADLSAMRMQVFTTATGVTVINDAYNANPTSMRAAIETLSDMQPAGRRIAVLGDMAELGSLTELAHFRIGEEVANLGLDELLTVGPRAKRIAEGATAQGMARSAARSVESATEAAALVAAEAKPGDAVLVKASRVMGLEMVVEAMVGEQ